MIEDGAFIGSDTQLVAPVRIGKRAVVARTTVTRDVHRGTSRAAVSGSARRATPAPPASRCEKRPAKRRRQGREERSAAKRR